MSVLISFCFVTFSLSLYLKLNGKCKQWKGRRSDFLNSFSCDMLSCCLHCMRYRRVDAQILFLHFVNVSRKYCQNCREFFLSVYSLVKWWIFVAGVSRSSLVQLGYSLIIIMFGDSSWSIKLSSWSILGMFSSGFMESDFGHS